ncbi:MAG: type II toxin-antitoxin system YafQ family toxin [Defluviitaleaceae bacterium]|nr:type II toxin-antitoxin system YafQ family toxin [Defluviitaleaceae bacterium]
MASEFKYTIFQTTKYKKTRRLAARRGYDMSLLEEAVIILAKGETLPPKYRDHQLKGNLSAFRECHIKGDWLLIYRIIEDKLVLSLHSTGSHEDLF